MNKAKIALILLTTVCLAMSGERVYDFYRGTQPPAKAGSCIELTASGRKFQAHVLRNDDKDKLSLIGIEIQPGIEIMEVFSYRDLHDMEVKEIPCEETK